MSRFTLARALLGAILCVLGMLPGPAQAAPETASFRVLAANVRSFPAMPERAYRADMARLFATKADALLGAEIIGSTGELAVWRSQARETGRRVVEPRFETTQALRHGKFADVASRPVFLHPAPGGPASPARWAVETRARVDGFDVAFVSLHLTNGCGSYPGRCDALRAEVARVRQLVARLHGLGFTVVVGGDLNRGPVVWASNARTLAYSTLMQLAVVPAADVSVSSSHRRVIHTRASGGVLFTDHNAILSTLTLTRR